MPRPHFLVNVTVSFQNRRQEYSISSFPAIIGRSKECEIRLSDSSVSRKHACLSGDEKGVFIEDLNSTNGTLVNSRKLKQGEKAALKESDVVGVGVYTLTIQMLPINPAEDKSGVINVEEITGRDKEEVSGKEDKNRTVIVCPSCYYGFVSDKSASLYTCDRCGFRWSPSSGTEVSALTPERRKPVYELKVVSGDILQSRELKQGRNTVGRNSDCTLVLTNTNIAPVHIVFHVLPEGVLLEDYAKESMFPVLHNGKKVQKAFLNIKDTVEVAGVKLRLEARYIPTGTGQGDTAGSERQGVEAKGGEKEGDGSGELILPYFFGGKENAEVSFNEGKDKLSIGRSLSNDLVLPEATVSRHHAKLLKKGEKIYLLDLKSAHGTFVNGRPILEKELSKGDRVQFGPYIFRFTGTSLQPEVAEGPGDLEICEASVRIDGGKKTLLESVSFRIKGGEFVGLLGPSGAGKTTLLNTIQGLRALTGGAVLFRGQDLHQNMDTFRNSIGYVPQDDIVHPQLTVWDALYYTARLRLPPDLDAAEIKSIIHDVLENVGLLRHSNTSIHSISGGQRKRVSVAIELISKPSLLFLDEPTSGLDPAAEMKLMALFRKLADQGRTLVCTTHVMESIELFDKIAIVSEGRLIFYGTPDEAKQFFGVNRATMIYAEIDEKGTSYWLELFEKSEFRKRSLPSHEAMQYAADKKKEPLGIEGVEVGKKGVDIRQKQGPKMRGQFLTLTKRYLSCILSDKRNLYIQLSQAVIISLLITVVVNLASYMAFFSSISALWFGALNASTEIVKERAIYRRERMVNLRIIPYVTSKFVVLSLICTAQVLILMAFMEYGIVSNPDETFTVFGYSYDQNKTVTISIAFRMHYYPHPIHDFPVWYFLVYELTALGGLGMGLVVSAFVSNSDKAISLIPIILIPQILFAGSIVKKIEDMSFIPRMISVFVLARWSFNYLINLMFVDSYLGEFYRGVYDVLFDLFMLIIFNIVLYAGTCFILLWQDRYIK
ncbi:MAG: FHA domain-containing protein [Thermoplasmata archaeon]